MRAELAVAAVDVVVLVAAVVACVAAVVGVTAAVVLVGQVRRLERGIESLRGETVPLVAEAREAVDRATSEMARVEAVLEDTEAVTATVDSASRLAQRAFANPVVKVLAFPRRDGRRAPPAAGGTMMKRPFWFGTGLAAGVAGTLWAEQRIRRQVAKLTPNEAVRQIGDRVRAAVDAGREERDRREAELLADLDRRTRARR